jgi:Zn-dependent M28 family amino/carboxypeptidase
MLHLCGMRRGALAGLLALGAPLSPASVCGQTPALDSALLMADISALAADSMEGRRVGTPGGARARAYLLRALTRIGLMPVADSLSAPFRAGTPSGALINGVNLVGMVRGSRRADRYVVVSAHYDHLGMRGKEIFHGADDNASGVAGVLALARWFAKHPPGNSLLFVLFDGEESGDVGSRAFVDNPPVPLERIVANVNLDMVSRNARGELYAAGASLYPVFKPLLDSTAAASRVKVLLGHDTGHGESNWIHQSDQGSFADKHIPFVYFGVEDHADYHRSTDTVERIQPGFFFQSVQTVADFVSRLDRNLDRVVAVRAGAHSRA